MCCKGVISACVVILVLHTNLVYSMDFRKHSDGFKPPFDTSKLSIDLVKLQFKDLMKGMMDDAGGKFVWKSPGYLDYIYLARDVGKPIAGYFGYRKGVELSEKELCQQLIGAGMGFGGSVVGTSVGSYLGTLVFPDGVHLLVDYLEGTLDIHMAKQLETKQLEKCFVHMY